MSQSQREGWKESDGELFRLLVENVKDYAIFVTDPEGRVQSWNIGAQRLLGYEEDETLGRSFEIFFTPEDIACGRPRREMQEALQEGAGNDDRWHVRKDGSRFWAGGSMTPLWDEAGKLRGFAKIMRDRTEWKSAQEQRASQTREAERRQRLYEAALSNTPDLVYVFDLDHRFTYANEGLLAMWGRTWEEAIGRNCLELGYEPWHAAMHDREIEEVIATRQPIKGEVPFTGAFGRRIYEYIFVPVIGENGEVEAVAGTTRDVTDRRQAEELVRHSEERYRSLMEQAPFSIQVFSPDGRTIRVNQAWEDLWGVRFEQIAGYNILEDRQLEEKGVLDYIRGAFAGEPARIPAIQYNPNDTIPDITQHADPRRWLSAVIYPIKDAERQVREVVLIHEDITARHRAEEALRDSEERLRLIADALPTLISYVDAEGVYRLNNQAYEEWFKHPRGEVTGRRVRDVVGEEAWAVVGPKMDAALRGHTVRYEAEVEYRDAGKRWIDATYVPHLDAKGRPLGLFVLVNDITVGKRAEEALRESERLYRAIGESIDYGVWVCDTQGRNIYASESFLRLVGLTQEQCTECGWGAVLHPDDVEETIAAWKSCVESGGEWDRELRFQGVDGRWHSVLARGAPVRNDRGEITAWAGIHLDISRIKQVEEKLREADRRKDEFLATLAHELRNPLAPIRNSLQILKMPRVDAATVQQARDMMERQVHHLVRLVDDLLDVSRVMRGKIELRREPVELANVVARAVETAKPLIEIQNHDLEISVPPESLLLYADPVRLAQVIGNLLTNSAKYTEANGRIWVTARRDDDQAVLSVRDTGIGIAPDVLPHVFELFVQADHASTKAQGGLGIGLTLVKNLVEMHGGSVEASSPGLGRGCEFVVRLPLMAPRKRTSLSGDGAAPSYPGPNSGRRILVVDDNRDAAVSLSLLLQLQGHDVRIAHDGPSALDVAVNFLPEAIFLDIGMPGMDGYEVARRLRNTPGMERTVLAALTGWGQKDDRRRTSEAGFNHHLVKPPEPKALEMVLADLKHI